MKGNKIKTRQEFYDFADVWYQRTKRLASYYQNQNNPLEKRLKAQKLYVLMFTRVRLLVDKAIEINKIIPKHHKGNTLIIGDCTPEIKNKI